MNNNVIYIFILFVLISCNKTKPKLFTNVDKEHSNVNFVNRLKPTSDLNILDYLYFITEQE